MPLEKLFPIETLFIASLEENPYSIRYTAIEICPCSKYRCADNTFGNKEMKVLIYVEYEVLYKNEVCKFLVYRYFHKFGLSQQFLKKEYMV